MIHRNLFFKAVAAVENLEVFDIINKMDNLSLNDKSRNIASSNSNSSLVSRPNTMYSSTSSIMEKFKSMNHSLFTRQIMVLTK